MSFLLYEGITLLAALVLSYPLGMLMADRVCGPERGQR